MSCVFEFKKQALVRILKFIGIHVECMYVYNCDKNRAELKIKFNKNTMLPFSKH